VDNTYRIYPAKRSIFSFFSITIWLIIINLICYVISLFVVLAYGDTFLSSNFALTPFVALSGKKLWTFLTSMFIHANFLHIFANMFSLFFIGSFLEKIIGKKRFFWLYMISGLIGGLFFVIAGYFFNNNLPGVGASGAIFGLVGVLAVLVPYSKIYLIAGPLLVIIAEAILTPLIPATFLSFFSLAMTVLIFIMLFAVFSFNRNLTKIAIPISLPMWLLPIVAIVPLTLIGFFVNLPIGNSAHFGGLVVGLVYGFYLRKKFPKKIKYISRQFSR